MSVSGMSSFPGLHGAFQQEDRRSAGQALKAYAPATVANFAAGFDCLGAAISPVDGSPLGDILEALPGTGSVDSLELDGPYASLLLGKDNLVLRTVELFRRELGVSRAGGAVSFPTFAFRLHKNLPVNSGLGSSASSVAATLVLLQELCGHPFDEDALLAIAGRCEGIFSGAVHYDNVGPCLRGGLRLIIASPSSSPECMLLPWPEELRIVVVHPDCELPTKVARQALPPSWSLPDLVAWGQNIAGFIHALHSGDRALLGKCFKDLIAESHRAPLVPGFAAAKDGAIEAGALGASLSGSGPSAFAVAMGSVDAEKVRAAMVAGFHAAGLSSQSWICSLDKLGTRILR